MFDGTGKSTKWLRFAFSRFGADGGCNRDRVWLSGFQSLCGRIGEAAGVSEIRIPGRRRIAGDPANAIPVGIGAFAGDIRLKRSVEPAVVVPQVAVKPCLTLSRPFDRMA